MTSLFTKVRMILGCFVIMLLVGTLTVVFYIYRFFRKLLAGDFTPAAERDDDLIGSAQAQLNALQAGLEKKEKTSKDAVKQNLSSMLWSRVFKAK